MWHRLRHEQRLDWLSWLGSPMLYDGGLFVNRTVDEHEASKILKC